MKLKKVTTRNAPMIRGSVLPLTREEKESLVEIFFKGSYKECYTKECSIEVYKSKSKISLASDSIIVEKLKVENVINNCGLNVGNYFKATKVINTQCETKYETEYFVEKV